MPTPGDEALEKNQSTYTIEALYEDIAALPSIRVQGHSKTRQTPLPADYTVIGIVLKYCDRSYNAIQPRPSLHLAGRLVSIYRYIG